MLYGKTLKGIKRSRERPSTRGMGYPCLGVREEDANLGAAEADIVVSIEKEVDSRQMAQRRVKSVVVSAIRSRLVSTMSASGII